MTFARYAIGRDVVGASAILTGFQMLMDLLGPRLRYAVVDVRHRDPSMALELDLTKSEGLALFELFAPYSINAEASSAERKGSLTDFAGHSFWSFQSALTCS